MRKGLILMDRDNEILGHLMYGPATVMNLYEHFFNNGNAKKSTRWRVMMRRLKKLERAKLIKSTFDPRSRGLIFVLQRAGAECAAEHYGREVSNSICFFPKAANIFHDLVAAGTAKIVIKELEQMEGYHFDYLHSEPFLRREEKAKKGLYYPDFRVRFNSLTKTITYDVEIDCGNISKTDFLGKMRSFPNIIIVITKTTQRLKLLRKYLLSIQIGKQIYLTTFDSVATKGFFRAEYWSRYYNKWLPLL